MSESVAYSDLSHDVWRTLGKRWTLPILKGVDSKEAMRFSEIKNALAGISRTMLSERLFELEEEGLVTKNFHCSNVEYSLTATGNELQTILAELERCGPRPPGIIRE